MALTTSGLCARQVQRRSRGAPTRELRLESRPARRRRRPAAGHHQPRRRSRAKWPANAACPLGCAQWREQPQQPHHLCQQGPPFRPTLPSRLGVTGCPGDVGRPERRGGAEPARARHGQRWSGGDGPRPDRGGGGGAAGAGRGGGVGGRRPGGVGRGVQPAGGPPADLPSSQCPPAPSDPPAASIQPASSRQRSLPSPCRATALAAFSFAGRSPSS